ncbi:MAG: transposase [Akkermansiaceae bacterium]|nr:transposase [Akkermansiaceae bacterium]MDP4896557.1 transposase [Akkermansiaceae bacterium]
MVERRFAFGAEEKEHFRMLMRMMEKFTGCRVLSYCLMCNHIHILLEVPPKPKDGISDGEFLVRLSALYGESFVADVAAQLDAARHEGGVVGGNPERVTEIKGRFDYRMNDLGEFMKGLMQRFTQWFNGRHKRKGGLWEDRFKSVIVESGTAARTMAAYIDLNPVRAGMVEDPAEYRWSGYGEAVGGGKKGNGKKARVGLARTLNSQNSTFNEETEEELAVQWKRVSRIYRRAMGLALQRKTSNFKSRTSMKMGISQNDAEALESGDNETVLPDLGMARMLRHRIRYFTDGAVIGSKTFVDDAFAESRDRFTEKRKDGARRMRGAASAAKDHLWSLRDLRVGV